MCDRNSGFVSGLFLGVIGGIIGGILFAPKTGEDTRAELKDKWDELSEKYSPEMEEAKKQAIQTVENLKCKLEKKCDKVKKSMKAKKMARAKKLETKVYD